MSDFIDLMESEGFDDYEPTTFESSEKIEFENTSGLPKKYLNMTINDLVRIKGGISGLKEWTSILKNLITADKIDQDMRERRNELIEKDFVVSNVFKYLNIFMDAVFDSAEAQNEIIIAHVLSDPEKAKKEIPELRKKAYTKISKEAKKSIKDSLKRLKKKYDDSEND